MPRYFTAQGNKERCRRCGGDEYIERKNYPFGIQSKVRVSTLCVSCGCPKLKEEKKRGMR